MRLERILLGMLGATGLILLINASMVAQQPAPTPVLVSQPASPLEIVSMRPTAVPAKTHPVVAKRMAFYEVVVRNKTDVPIMAYAISHEARFGDGAKTNRICQASMGFSNPMIAAREIKAISSNLHNHGSPSTTPVMDLVLLEDGSYFGNDSCGYLQEYQRRLDERLTVYQAVLRRLQNDGVDKTAAWLKQELSRDSQPLLSPKKMGTSVLQ